MIMNFSRTCSLDCSKRKDICRYVGTECDGYVVITGASNLNRINRR